MSEPPELSTFRAAVERIPHKRDSLFIKATYLTASRACELLTKVTPYDLKHKQTKPYGNEVSYKIEEYEDHKVLVLKMAVLKRKARVQRKGQTTELKVYKMVALPTLPKYEPWTLDLMKYIRKRGTLAFDFTRQTAWEIVTKRLGSLSSMLGTHTHSLRHFRLTHLVTEYNFDAFDLTSFAGWTFKTGLSRTGQGAASGQLDTYLHLAWRRYYPKLLKEIK